MKKEKIFTNIVEWLYLNDRAYSSSIEWREALIAFLKEELELVNNNCDCKI